MKYIIILLFLASCSAKTEKKKAETKEQLISQVIYKNKPVSIILQNLSLLNGKLIIDLPKGFDIMGKEMLDIKYPSSNRPTLVYTNENGTINFAFNHTNNDIPKDKLPEILPAFVKQFSSIYPQIEWFKKGVEKFKGKDFVVLEFITPAIDSKIYNLMYVTVLEGKMLMCTFNCLESQKEEWEIKAKESLNSIVIKE
jgi:hypothetical protein